MVALLGVAACQEKSGFYDLNSKKRVKLARDENTGIMMDVDTRKPVYIYVDESTNDTISGLTGKVVNGMIILEDGKYKYEGLKVKVDEDGDFKLKDGDYKKKIDADGDEKTKDGDRKKKSDADGDRK